MTCNMKIKRIYDIDTSCNMKIKLASFYFIEPNQCSKTKFNVSCIFSLFHSLQRIDSSLNTVTCYLMKIYLVTYFFTHNKKEHFTSV